MEGLVIKIPSAQTSPDSIRKEFNEGIIWPLRNLFGESWTGKYWPRCRGMKISFDINLCLPDSHSGSVKEFTDRKGLLAHGFLSTPGEVCFFDFYEEGVAVIKTEFRSRGEREEDSWREIIKNILNLTIAQLEQNGYLNKEILLTCQQNLANLSALEPSKISTP